MSRVVKGIRLFIILSLLKKQRSVSIKDLVTVTGTSERSIFRDIKDLRSIGIPIYNGGRGYKADKSMLENWISEIIDRDKSMVV